MNFSAAVLIVIVALLAILWLRRGGMDWLVQKCLGIKQPRD